MQADTRSTPNARIQTLAAMAGLLERLDRQPSTASAGQYQGVVRQVNALLAEAEPGPALEALLAASPAAATLYENLNYQHAGLCRSPLDGALNAELAAQAAIQKARRPG